MDVREKLMELPIEDALLVLREEHRQRTDSYTTYLAHGGKGDPAEEVGLDALAIAISALEKTKWISVKDRLPEKNQAVLGWYKDNPFAGYTYGVVSWNGRGWVFVYAQRYVTNVTHWMQMPEPPQTERMEQ